MTIKQSQLKEIIKQAVRESLDRRGVNTAPLMKPGIANIKKRNPDFFQGPPKDMEMQRKFGKKPPTMPTKRVKEAGEISEKNNIQDPTKEEMLEQEIGGEQNPVSLAEAIKRKLDRAGYKIVSKNAIQVQKDDHARRVQTEPKVNEDTAGEIKAGFNAMSGGITDSIITRMAALAAQGRYDEADRLLRSKVHSSNFQKISQWMRQQIKPVKGATTEKLLDHPEFKEWVWNHFVPFIKSQTKVNEGSHGSFSNDPAMLEKATNILKGVMDPINFKVIPGEGMDFQVEYRYSHNIRAGNKALESIARAWAGQGQGGLLVPYSFFF